MAFLPFSVIRRFREFFLLHRKNCFFFAEYFGELFCKIKKEFMNNLKSLMQYFLTKIKHLHTKSIKCKDIIKNYSVLSCNCIKITL